MAKDMPQGSSLPNKQWNFDGFQQGNDTFSLATEISKNAVHVMENAELYGKRSLRPRRGGTALGNSLGAGTIDGLYQFRDGDVNDILGLCLGQMKKYNISTGLWEDVDGETFTSGLRTRATKLRGALYFGNGTDDFSKYTDADGVETFTAVAAPTGLAVTQNGSTGTAKYEYTVTTVTGKGQSLPATNVAITNGAETLTETNNISVVFNRRTEDGVIGYNVFGRAVTGTGVTLMRYIPQPSSGATVTFTDDGSITPQVWLPPEGDSTDGIKGTILEQLKGSLIIAGVEGEEHRLFFTGTGDRYESFSPAHNGGWADVRPGDNDLGVNGFSPFESKVIVAKQNSIHQFYFDSSSGDAVIQELISYVGCGAPGSMIVMENDVALLDSERKMRIIGYEPNFNTAIRTTSLSEGRVQSLFNEINPNKIANAEAVYYKGKYILAVTGTGSEVNDRVIAYDRRYLSFLGKWTGKNCHARCWLVWDGLDGQKKLFAGSSDDDGVVYQFDEEGKLTDHDGSAVQTTLRFRNEDLKNSGQVKIWKWTDLRLYRIYGTINIKTIMDGVTTIDERSFTSVVRTGWGVVQWGSQKWGTATGEPAEASDLDQTRRKEIYETGNSLQHEITKTNAQTDFVLVSLRGEAFVLPPEVFDSAKYV